MSKQNDKSCFQLKADFYPLTVLKLHTFNLDAFNAQLTSTIETAPKYFEHTPVILDVDDLTTSKTKFNLKSLCEALREKTIFPVGIRGLKEKDEKLATEHGLVMLNKPERKPKPEPVVEKKPEAQPTSLNKLVDKPVRAGTRIYSRGDLTVLAAVNDGGEVIADGNIHIYGPLRGRALAGAKGDSSARIFCQSLKEADLVCIAGRYLMNEDIKVPKTKGGMLQIYLENDKLTISSI